MSIRGQRPTANSTDTISGIAKELSQFSCIRYLDDLELSDGLLSGSISSAAVIACSDMGCLVPYVCSSANVKLFLFQNFGHQFASSGVVDTVLAAGIEHVVVYGHSPCKYTRHLAKLPHKLPHENEAQRQLFTAALESDSDEMPWKKVGQYNVLSELRRMLENPIIAPLAAAGRLKLHGWFYSSEPRQLEVFDPAQEAFIEKVK